MIVKRVPLEFVNIAWKDARKFIASALEYSNGEYTPDQAKTLITQGIWTLLLATEDSAVVGAATVTFFNLPNDRVALVTAVGGRAIGSTEMFKQLKMFAQSMGATVIQGAARESVARLWRKHGFEEKYRIVEVRL